MKGELRTLGLKLDRTRHFMIRFKNGGLFNLDGGQINLGKIYIVGDRSKVKYLIFLGTSRFY